MFLFFKFFILSNSDLHFKFHLGNLIYLDQNAYVNQFKLAKLFEKWFALIDFLI